jgi:hypothetical protein
VGAIYRAPGFAVGPAAERAVDRGARRVHPASPTAARPRSSSRRFVTPPRLPRCRASMALIRQAHPDPVARGRGVAMWAMGGAVAPLGAGVGRGARSDRLAVDPLHQRAGRCPRLGARRPRRCLTAATCPVRLGRPAHRRAGDGRAHLRGDRSRVGRDDGAACVGRIRDRREPRWHCSWPPNGGSRSR